MNLKKPPIRVNVLVALLFVSLIVGACLILNINAENVVMAYIGLIGGLFHSLLTDEKEKQDE